MSSARPICPTLHTNYLAAAPRIFCAAPVMQLSLRDALRQLAASAWAEIEAGDRVGLRLGEEALTDYLLMRLAGAVPGRVIINKYHRREEAEHGADYEFILGNRRRFVRLRVQAKRLDLYEPGIPKYRYRELWKKRKKEDWSPIYQCDALVAASQRAIPEAFPVYSFYNAWNVDRLGPAGSWCRVAPQIDLLGWTLAPAELVGRLRRRAAGAELHEVNALAHSIACEIGEVDATRGNVPLADAVKQRFDAALEQAERLILEETVDAVGAQGDGGSELGRLTVHSDVEQLPPHLALLFARASPNRRMEQGAIVDGELAAPPEDDQRLS